MDNAFRAELESLHPALTKLREMSPVSVADLRPGKLSGIYLFSESVVPMYVGRTRNLRSRFRGHCGEKSGENQAPFAFKLARIEMNQEKATYQKKGSRKELMKDVVFADAFRRAKAMIRSMELRFVEEPDPLRQTMLEVYATFVLKAEHNDFETH